jgi:hypothetical protein
MIGAATQEWSYRKANDDCEGAYAECVESWGVLQRAEEGCRSLTS